MRAVVVEAYGGVDNLALKEVAGPVPGDGEFLIDVHAAGITFADLLVIQGKYQDLPDLPFVIGKEAAGVVTRVGKGVSGVRVGDRVMAQLDHGAYAEQAVGLPANCHVIPDDATFVDAAAMGIAYQTAHFALIDRAQYCDGETVLVNGASGGIGLACVQLAKAKGATVLAGLPGLDDAEVVLQNGADHVIDLGREDLANSLREQVFSFTGGRGVDVVLDPVGADVFDASLRALAWRGRIVVIGFVGGRIPTIKSNYLLLKNIAVSGLFWNTYREREPEWVRRVQDELFDLYLAGKLKPQVMKVVPLDEFASALSLIAEGKVQGRAILAPQGLG